MSETRYYAVGDRLVEVGAECRVLDWSTGDLVTVDRDYAQVTVGSGKGVDPLTADEFAAALLERRADVLVSWAGRIARGSGTTPYELHSDLGVLRTLVEGVGGTRIEPPPLGASKVVLLDGPRGIAAVQVTPPEGLVLGMLDRRLGARRELPRVHWNNPWTSSYDVSVAGGGRCTVCATTRAEPAPDAPVVSVMLRTEPKS